MNSERRRDASGASTERSIDRLLRRRLRAGQGAPPAGACLEPDTLAAWIEGSLGREELAAAESHSAGCERCQATLAAMMQTEPVVQRRRWWQSLTARWLVPAAAAATAAALWISVAPDRPQRGPVPLSEADSSAATGPASTQARTGDAPATPSSTPPSPPPAAEARSVRGNRIASVDALDRASPPPQAKAVEEKTETLAARRDRAQPGQAGRSLVADRKEPPPPPASPAAPAPPAVELKPQQEVTSGLPPSAQLGGQVGARSAQDARTYLRTTPVASIDIVSPDPAIRWRAGGNGLVLRSADGGVTWVAQESGTTLDFTAGSSPARDVCWLVGRRGVVLLSIDGKTWTQRPFPEPVDLAVVSATDAKTATITTSDGRRFSTTDGGATWSRPSPQEFPAAPF